MTAPKIIKGKRKIRKDMEALKAGMAKVEMAVAATTITIPGETSPARMAASPMTKPPTILTA